MFRHVSPVFLFLLSGVCCLSVNAQDQIIPQPVSVKIVDKSGAKPVKLDGGTRIVCREKDAGFQRQARLLNQFCQAEPVCPWRGRGERVPSA